MLGRSIIQFKDEKERREKDLLHAELDFDKCGLAAVQTMAGEDPGKLARIAQQHAQVGTCGWLCCLGQFFFGLMLRQAFETARCAKLWDCCGKRWG